MQTLDTIEIPRKFAGFLIVVELGERSPAGATYAFLSVLLCWPNWQFRFDPH
jgi:hypothetical protein